jgi:LuxR family transcriptional regulator, quorum-sensing system regulator BjaR1
MEEINSFENVSVFTFVSGAQSIKFSLVSLCSTFNRRTFCAGWRVMGQVHDYVKVAFDLIDDLDRLTEVDSVMSRVSATLADFGYTSFLITGVPEPPQRLEPYILLNGWPKGCTDHYTGSNYYPDDPVAAWCRRTVNPFEWSQAPFDAARWPRAAEVMAIAREFGVTHQRSTTRMGVHADEVERLLRSWFVVGSLASHRDGCLESRAANDRHEEPFIEAESDGQRRRVLSERERDVLAWAAEGKSSWEIATILGVSERTVNWHVERSKKKLDAVTRTQAVIKALRSGEI